MLDENDNDRHWDLAGEAFNDGLCDSGSACIFETSWHCTKNRKFVLFSGTVVSVHEPADHCVQQNHKNDPQCRDEEPEPLLAGLSLSGKFADPPDEIQQEKRCEADSCINFGVPDLLKCVNDYQVRGCSIVDDGTWYAQETWHLSDGDIDS